jgi:predicted MFS family arabinose efflux permease
VRVPRWRIRAVLAIPALRPMIALYFLIYLAFSIYVAALPVHAVVDAGCTVTDLSRLYVTLALALAATERFVLPRIARKLATPVIAAGGCALLIAAYLLISGSSEAALTAGAVLYGVGNGLMWPSYLVMLSHSGPAEYQGSIQGVGSSAGSLASIVGTVTGGVLFVTIGVATFYVSAAVVAVATCLFIARVPGFDALSPARSRTGRRGPRPSSGAPGSRRAARYTAGPRASRPGPPRPPRRPPRRAS